MPGFGELAQWLQKRVPRSDAAAAEPVIPPGDGPLVLLCGLETGAVATALRRLCPPLRVGALGQVAVERGARAVPMVLPEPPGDPQAARRLLELTSPGAVLLSNDALPAGLVAACEEAAVPVTLVTDASGLAAAAARRVWRGGRRGPLARLSRVLVPDAPAREAALREGIAPLRVEIIGTALPILPPLPCNPRELAALRPHLRDRPVWLAAALPLRELTAVMAAHEGLLSARHRALLIIAPARAGDADAIAAALAERGLTVARIEDADPGPEVQVLLAEDSSELGLWYRLAAVTYAGGTLIRGADPAPRHPFEPAGLGTAIVHGPAMGEHAAHWQALDRAGGARQIHGPLALPRVIEELAEPDTAARLARAAWEVATEGAEITRRIAEAVLSDLQESC